MASGGWVHPLAWYGMASIGMVRVVDLVAISKIYGRTVLVQWIASNDASGCTRFYHGYVAQARADPILAHLAQSLQLLEFEQVDDENQPWPANTKNIQKHEGVPNLIPIDTLLQVFFF